jgi:hypothetical protein
MRVMYAVLGDRAEQRLSESPAATAAHHQQVRVGRGMQQNLGRMTVDDPGADQVTIAGLDVCLEYLVESLERILMETVRLIQGYPGVGCQRRRNVPGHDGVH